MRHRFIAISLALVMLLTCAACGTQTTDQTTASEAETAILLSDEGVQVNGQAASEDPTEGVYVGGEIIYYKDGTDETYGEGTEEDMHSAEEAGMHTVVTITQPGTYRVSGSLSMGQIFIDLGEDAESDPEAVVNLVLDGVDITCTVAPAVLFYNVYECGPTEEDTSGPAVDTTTAGANVIIAAGSENNVNGSYVARIYKEGTEKKLHKYDGAFYSKMSMNISGEMGDDSGVLNIIAENEGLDSEMHLTINGGTISIESQNDGINTNEDNISVTTINGGILTINAGLGEEGDGIDSNGYLTINGGTLFVASHESSADGGIDADKTITINGGAISAFGNQNGTVSDTGTQPAMTLQFARRLAAGSVMEVLDSEGTLVWTAEVKKPCQSVVVSCPGLTVDGVYTVTVNGVVQSHGGFGGGMKGDVMFGGNMEQPEWMENMTPPDAMEEMTPPEGMELPENMEGMTPPEGFDPQRIEGMERPELPENMGEMGASRGETVETSTEFVLTGISTGFNNVMDAQSEGAV